MSMLVDEKFREWTADLDGKDALISVFEHVRDIPYSFAVTLADPDTAPEQILSCGRGNCGPKHYLLAEMYRRLGYDVVYATFPFLWNDPDLHYPPDLRELATGLPVAHHLACRVRIDSCWVLVDATWDLPLARGGFPVNRHWDGRTDTLCAVKQLRSSVRTAFCRTTTNEPYRARNEQDLNPLDGEQDYGDVMSHARFYREKTGTRSSEETERIRRFYREFDSWLQDIREHP
jgi:transglutaminase-like putative cysteine protease